MVLKFLSTYVQLLKGACLKCHMFQPSRWTIRLIKLQIKALDRGLLALADEMAEIARNIVAESEEENYVLADTVETTLKERLEAAIKEGKDKLCVVIPK